MRIKKKVKLGLRFAYGLKFIMARVLKLDEGESEGEVAVFSAKRWDRRNRADLIDSATACHDAQVVGSYRGSNPLHLTVLTSKSEDYTTAPQHNNVYSVLYLMNIAVTDVTFVVKIRDFYLSLKYIPKISQPVRYFAILPEYFIPQYNENKKSGTLSKILPQLYPALKKLQLP